MFISDTTLRSNISYTLMMSDAVYWMLIRTDLSGTAGEMLIKLYVFIAGTLIESITKSYLKGACGKGYKDRTQHLVTVGIITGDLKTELDWVWDARNNMHLFLLDDSEWVNDYTAATHKRCVAAFKKLVEVLATKGPLEAAG